MNFTRVVKVTTASADAEILQQEVVKQAIKNCLGLDEAAYQSRLVEEPPKMVKQGFNMAFDIISDVDTPFSINGESQALIGGTAYSSGGVVKVTSIKMHGVGSAVIAMNIRS